MPGRREEKKARTREAILREAALLIEKNGYAGTSMEQVAKAAGIAVGTTYNYFDTKAALLSAITETRLARLEGVLGSIPEDGSPADRVSAVLAESLRYLSLNPKRLWAEAWSGGLAARDGSTGFWDLLETRLLPYLDDCFEGRTGDMDPGAASEMAASILMRYVYVWIIDDDVSADDLASDLMSDARFLVGKITSR